MLIYKNNRDVVLFWDENISLEEAEKKIKEDANYCWCNLKKLELPKIKQCEKLSIIFKDDKFSFIIENIKDKENINAKKVGLDFKILPKQIFNILKKTI